MSINNKTFSIIGISALFLYFFTLLVALLAWITYGTIEEVFGMMAFLLLGGLNVYPWLIPFIGIPLGFLDFFQIFGVDMYHFTLSLSRIEGSWMTLLWYWIVSALSILLNILFSLLIILKLRDLKYKEKGDKDSNLAFINCNIIDGKLESAILKDGIILIQNQVDEESGNNIGTIAFVGTKDDGTIPDDYKVIDLEGKYILPGLINAHCHLTGSGKPMKIMNLSDEMMEFGAKLMKKRLIKHFLYRMIKKNAFNALNAGVTTLRAMSDPEYLDVKLRKAINEGKVLGPRLIVAGKGICITGGHGGPMAYIADSVPEIRKAIRKNLRNEVDFIKILSTGGVMDARKVGEAGRPQMTVEEIETACQEAHRANLLVATHCESTEGLKEALKGGVDTIEHGAEIPDDLVEQLKNNPKSLRGYTALIPTVSAGMGLATLPPEETKITHVKFQNAILVEKGLIQGLRKAYETGIVLGLGTDASVPYSTHYGVWKELKYYLKYTDMSAQEAIYCATLGNAKIIGIEHITGSIEKGKSADMIVVKENPLEYINTLENVEKIIIRGKLISTPKVKKVKNLKEIKPIEV